MRTSGLKKLSVAALCAGVFILGGCNGDGAQVTFLDIVNTVLLGITAAGGIVLLRND
jgi:hypothetical protein